METNKFNIQLHEKNDDNTLRKKYLMTNFCEPVLSINLPIQVHISMNGYQNGDAACLLQKNPYFISILKISVVFKRGPQKMTRWIVLIALDVCDYCRLLQTYVVACVKSDADFLMSGVKSSTLLKMEIKMQDLQLMLKEEWSFVCHSRLQLCPSDIRGTTLCNKM